VDYPDLWYIAEGMGATVRGASILKELGYGCLVTPYRLLADEEGVAWFGGISLYGDVFIWDRPGRLPHRPGLQLTIGEEREGFIPVPLDVPVVPRKVEDLDIDRAAEWWERPTATLIGKGQVRTFDRLPGASKILRCQGRPDRFSKHRQQPKPLAETVIGWKHNFYWPAMELMPLADEVHGGDQTMAELSVVRGEHGDDGAAVAAKMIQEHIEPYLYELAKKGKGQDNDH